MLPHKLSNKLLNLLLNLYSPCISMEPFTLATSCSTCVRECCWNRSHWTLVEQQVATHFRANDVICSLLLRATQTCRRTCGQCERTRQQVEPQVRPLVSESFHTSNKLSNLCGNMCGNMWPVWKHYKMQSLDAWTLLKVAELMSYAAGDR